MTETDWTSDPERYQGMNAGGGGETSTYSQLSPGECFSCSSVQDSAVVLPYVTKDSGERVQHASGLQRDTNKGKPRFDLLRPALLPYHDQLLTRFAALMARGAEKYDERNWEKANTEEDLDRFRDSASRHFEQWMNEEIDEDHAAAVLFNIMGAEYVKWRLVNGEVDWP